MARSRTSFSTGLYRLKNRTRIVVATNLALRRMAERIRRCQNDDRAIDRLTYRRDTIEPGNERLVPQKTTPDPPQAVRIASISATWLFDVDLLDPHSSQD
jgi:hypothetical protein